MWEKRKCWQESQLMFWQTNTETIGATRPELLGLDILLLSLGCQLKIDFYIDWIESVFEASSSGEKKIWS